MGYNVIKCHLHDGWPYRWRKIINSKKFGWWVNRRDRTTRIRRRIHGGKR
jgi:hypothetical protein